MTAATLTVELGVDPAVSECLSALADVVRSSSQIGKALFDLFEPGSQAFRLDLDWMLASRTEDGRVVLEPSKRLRDLVAACRAGDLDAVLIEVYGVPGDGRPSCGDGSLSSSGSNTLTEGAPPIPATAEVANG